MVSSPAPSPSLTRKNTTSSIQSKNIQKPKKNTLNPSSINLNDTNRTRACNSHQNASNDMYDPQDLTDHEDDYLLEDSLRKKSKLPATDNLVMYLRTEKDKTIVYKCCVNECTQVNGFKL